MTVEDSHLLSIVLTRAIKQDPLRFAQQYLFGPLGIENYSWLLDDEGNLQGASGLSLTARDMAKIGSLYLRGGKWDGMQLVPETYVTEATQEHNHGGSPVRAADYGYLWWITRPAGGDGRILCRGQRRAVDIRRAGARSGHSHCGRPARRRRPSADQSGDPPGRADAGRQTGFATGITPPSAAVSSAATSRTALPSAGTRSSVTLLVMPDTEIAASGSLQSL